MVRQLFSRLVSTVCGIGVLGSKASGFPERRHSIIETLRFGFEIYTSCTLISGVTIMTCQLMAHERCQSKLRSIGMALI